MGDYRPQWVETKQVEGIPYDLAIVGFGARTVNFLRLWEAKASEQLDLQVFNQGGYVEAVREKAMGESISKVLYPNDETESGKELRLVQQYFFVACSLQDMISRFRRTEDDWDLFPEKVVVQLNDTHPAVAILELMRIFLDVECIAWERAWGLVRKTFAYTNHTLLPEALETWGESLFEKVLPRHLQIVREINRRFVAEELAARWPEDREKAHALSIVADGQIRMAFLSVVGSYSVNGVAALHTKLLKNRLLKDFADLYPEKFNNKTNGITPGVGCWVAIRACRVGHFGGGRGMDYRFELASRIGESCRRFFLSGKFMAIKRKNKVVLSEMVKNEIDVSIDPDALFDSQIKRLHEYKRQHLNLLHLLTFTAASCMIPAWIFHPGFSSSGRKRLPVIIWPRLSFMQSTWWANASTRTPESRGSSRLPIGLTTEFHQPKESFRPPIFPSKSRQLVKRHREPET